MARPRPYKTKAEALAVALQYKKLSTFRAHQPALYKTIVRLKWLDELTQHMVRSTPGPRKISESKASRIEDILDGTKGRYVMHKHLLDDFEVAYGSKAIPEPFGVCWLQEKWITASPKFDIDTLGVDDVAEAV
jgi:hypothetical protein